MAISRMVVSACFLVMGLGVADSTVMGGVPEVFVSAGDDVLLQCKCSENTRTVIWQIGEHTLVNFYNANGSVSESYRDRTQLFLPYEKGNCSLLLKRVSLSDNEIFSCFFMLSLRNLNKHDIKLSVQAVTQSTPAHLTNPFNLVTFSFPDNPERHVGVSIGVPFSLVALLLLAGVIIILLMRCRRQRSKTVVVVLDPKTAQPMMSHVPV